MSDDKKRSNNVASDGRRRKLVTFEPGTMVWMLSHARGDMGTVPKLRRKFRGPYVVIHMVGDTAVRIRPVGSADAHSTVHADQLVPYKIAKATAVKLTSPERAHDGEETRVDSGDDVQGDAGDWAVEQVKDHRFSKGKLQSLVKWSGGDFDDEWIDEASMNCHLLVQEYFQQKCSHP
jgi:hypothetical protein